LFIELDTVNKEYFFDNKPISVLKDVSLRILSGDFVVIKGISGSGKTTLLNILGLLDTPSSGTYKLKGKNIVSANENQKSIIRNQTFGYVFQAFNLIPSLTVFQNIALPLKYSGHNFNDHHIESLIEKVGLSHRSHFYPKTLSGGEQQRVAIARALVNNPKVILSDEPTGNLDSKNTEFIMKTLLELNQQGLTIILVTHEDSVAKYGNRVITVKDGYVQKTT